MLAIETKKLTKRFGTFTAVDELDLRVNKGELYGLLGPNGAGKTTAVKIMVGLLRATSGETIVLDRKIPDRSILPNIGYMPQNLALYENLTIHENMSLFGTIYGMSRKQIEAKEKELLEIVDLYDWKDTVVLKLSGGMKHRASLACTLIHEPEMLFLDEPTVGVDPELRATFWEYFNGMVESGVTVIITTHYMDEATRCNRVGLMRKGQLVAEGTPGEIMAHAGVNSLEDAFLAIVKRQGDGGGGKGGGKGGGNGRRAFGPGPRVRKVAGVKRRGVGK